MEARVLCSCPPPLRLFVFPGLTTRCCAVCAVCPQRNVYDPIKALDPYGTVINPADGTPVTTKAPKGGKKWNEMDAYGPNAERRHRGYAPCPGDLAHLPGNQPHHTVFTPSFLDIKKDERYTRTSSRIGKAYCMATFLLPSSAILQL
eukprot:COSAG03_NODE_4791_length_1432_cov_8.265566_1_plen_147_part_00